MSHELGTDGVAHTVGGGTDARAIRDKFLSLRDCRELATLLQIKYSSLIHHVRRVQRNQKYRSFQIPKRSGGFREILAPEGGLKTIQRRLADILHAVYLPKPCAHGFVCGRCVRTNAGTHARKRIVLNLDLLDFFPSINFGRVHGMFLNRPYSLPRPVATMLAQICCCDVLPQGAPTSPIISNMICARLDSELLRVAKRARCTFSRYADDLSFSTRLEHLPNALATVRNGDAGPVTEIGAELLDVIHRNGFRVNDSKTRVQYSCHRQEVTGLVVNRFPNVRRAYVRQIRSMLHAWRKFGEAAAQSVFLQTYDKKHRRAAGDTPFFHKVVKGMLDYLSMIRGNTDEVHLRLLRQYCELVGKPFVPPKGPMLERIESLKQSIYLVTSQCGESERQGTAFLVRDIGLITCNHVLFPNGSAQVLRPELDQSMMSVQVLARWPDVDLAILECPIKDAPALECGYSGSVNHLTRIAAMSFPSYYRGDSLRVQQGEVQGTKVYFGSTHYKTSFSIYKGSSGGPVFDDETRVIGIMVSGIEEPLPEEQERKDVIGVLPIQYLKEKLAENRRE